MKVSFKNKFLDLWDTYFPKCEPPIICYYSDHLNGAMYPKPPKPNKKGYTCVISQLAPVRKGRSRAFNRNNIGCTGAFRPFGFDDCVTKETKQYMCNVKRVKKSIPHLESMFTNRKLELVSEKYIVFKRWDMIRESDNPKIVFFFGNSDIISGLHGLVNFDTMDPNGMISPFATGCDSIVGLPLGEYDSNNPKAILGALDPSVRTRFKSNQFTFSVPWTKFTAMVNNMEDSFLTTDNWVKIKSRFMKK